jgi:hypothetical protein
LLEFVFFNPAYEKFASASSISENSGLELRLCEETTSFSLNLFDLVLVTLLVTYNSLKESFGFTAGELI